MFILFIIALGGKCKDRSSQIIGNIVSLWALLEPFLILILAITAIATESSIVFLVLALLLFFVKILQNLIFFIIFFRKYI